MNKHSSKKSARSEARRWPTPLSRCSIGRSETAMRIVWGKGGKWGSFAARVRGAKGTENTLFYLWMQSKNVFVELPLGYFTSDCPLSDLAVRQEFLCRVNKIPGIDLPPDSVEKRRSFPLELLTEGTALSEFLAILDWAIVKIDIEDKAASATLNGPSSEVQ